MANIFLDTNILLPDPLFKSEFSLLLLKLSKEGKVKIYIPSLVIDELLNKYQQQLNDEVASLNKHFSHLKKITNLDLKVPEVNNVDCLDELKAFYDLGFTNCSFQLLKYRNDFLPEVIRRSINRIKPFSQNKQEFRDCIIWLTIIHEIKENGLEENFLITNNIHDFYDEKKDNLHPILREDCDIILPYKSLKDLIVNQKKLLELKEQFEFERWVQEQNINNFYIQIAIKGFLWEPVLIKINEIIKKFDIGKIYGNNIIGYLQPFVEKRKIRIEETSLSIIEQFVLITSKISFEFFAFINLPQISTSTFTPQREGQFLASCSLSFTLHKQGKLTLNDIEDMTIIDITSSI